MPESQGLWPVPKRTLRELHDGQRSDRPSRIPPPMPARKCRSGIRCPAFLNGCSPDRFGKMCLSMQRKTYQLITHSLQTGSLNMRSGRGRLEQTHAPMERVHVGSHPPSTSYESMRVGVGPLLTGVNPHALGASTPLHRSSTREAVSATPIPPPTPPTPPTAFSRHSRTLLMPVSVPLTSPDLIL